MRNILFKAKTEEGKWLEGYLHKIDGVSKGYRAFAIQVQDIDTAMCRPHSHEVIPETIGQFTGLTDKNGKKIFEGDIVRFTNSPFGHSNIGVVCFYKGSFCIQYKYFGINNFHQIGKTDRWEDMGASGIVTYEYKIIGNLHDNPELLGE